MKAPSRIIVAALVAAIAFPCVALAAKGERRNKKDDSAAVAFDTVDKSKDGAISEEEFVSTMQEKLGKDAAKLRFATLDKDSNGKLSKEEYMAGSTETKKKRKKNAN